VASNNVVLADIIASKLMGFDPFKDIKFLRYARSMMGTERSLLGSIPNDLYLTAPQLISKWELPANFKDGNWEKADPSSVEETQNFIENAYGIPGAATVYNIGADFLLLDAANLPYWNTIQRALMRIMFAPRFWTEKTEATGASKNRTRINLAIFSILALISLYFFFTEDGYLPHSLFDLNKSLGIILGLILTLILGALFARMMETKHLIAIAFSSFIIAYLVESYAPIARWWIYTHEAPADVSWFGISWLAVPPHWPLFVIPLFIITLVGISYHVVMPTLFSLNGRRFRLVPYVVVTLGIIAFLYFGGYVNYVKLSDPTTSRMMIIYCIMAILALYLNERNNLDWNLAVVLVAVSLGFLMEYFGNRAGYWIYLDPNNTETILEKIPVLKTIPVFVSLSWALNVWAVGGLALIFGKNMSQSFVKDQTFDPEDPQALSHRGDTFRADCNYDEALKFYDKAIEKNPKLAEAYQGKGMALAGQGDFKNSVKAYDEAVDLYQDMYPDSAVAHVAQVLYHEAVSMCNLEGPLEALKAFEDAQDYSSQALKANPRIIDTYIDVLLDHALAHQELGNYKESVDLCEKGLNQIKKFIPAQDHAELWDFMGFSQIDGANGGALDCCSSTKALDNFDRAIKLSSRDTDRTWSAAALWGKGYALSMLEKYDESLHAFDDALHAFQDSPHVSHNSTLDQPSESSVLVWSDKGDALWDQGKFKEAVLAYNKAIDLYTEFADEVKRSQGWRVKEDSHYKVGAQAHKGKGDAHFELRNFDYAFKAYSRSIQLLDKFVDDSDAKSAKGCTLSRMGRYKEAIKAYSDAIKIASKKDTKEAEIGVQPSMSVVKKRALEKAHIGKGNVHAKMVEFNESLIEYDKAIQINDKNIIAWNNKGIAYASLGKNDFAMYDKAIECYKNAIGANELYADAWYNKGIALNQKGRYFYEEGLKAYDEVLKTNYQRRSKDSFEDALGAYDQALRINSRHPSAWNNKGAVLADLDRNDEALAAYSQAITVNSKDAEAWYNKGLIFFDQKKYDEALKCFNQTIRANPRFAEAYYYKGMALYGQGKKESALKYIKNSLKLKPSLTIAGSQQDITQISEPPIVPGKGKAQQKAERLNSRYDEVWLQRGAYFVMLRHMNREG
jgi:tetratricopeptide (TPR) repeat protein